MPSFVTGNARVPLVATFVLLLAGGAGWRSIHEVRREEPAATRSAKIEACRESPSAGHRDAASLSPEEILALPDPAHCLEELTDRALAVPLDEVPAVLCGLASPLLESPYAEILVRRWAERAPRPAISWASGLTRELTRTRLRCAAIVAWAGEDLAAAERWVTDFAEPGERTTLLLETARAGLDGAPLVSLRIASALPASPARDELIADGLREWSVAAPDQAAAWALALPETMARQHALAEVSVTVAHNDSAAAIDLALDHLPDDGVFAGAILGIVSQASQGNPERTREWIDRFPDGPLKKSALAEFTRIERGLLPSVNALPGEDTEDRTPREPPRKLPQ